MWVWARARADWRVPILKEVLGERGEVVWEEVCTLMERVVVVRVEPDIVWEDAEYEEGELAGV